MTELEFTKRFAAYCLKTCGFTHFEGGKSVEEYCGNVAKSYYDDPDYRDVGPEACAEYDMSDWGAE